jgi:hypothetical protein
MTTGAKNVSTADMTHAKREKLHVGNVAEERGVILVKER